MSTQDEANRVADKLAHKRRREGWFQIVSGVFLALLTIGLFLVWNELSHAQDSAEAQSKRIDTLQTVLNLQRQQFENCKDAPAGTPGCTQAVAPPQSTDLQGPQGIQGLQGIAGPQGIQGPPGKTGATGSRGPRGFTGLSGSAGQQGQAGSTGPSGSVGPPGPKGEKGDPGKDGKDGTNGTNGSDGTPGRGISSVTCDPDTQQFVVNYTDGSSQQVDGSDCVARGPLG